MILRSAIFAAFLLTALTSLPGFSTALNDGRKRQEPQQIEGLGMTGGKHGGIYIYKDAHTAALEALVVPWVLYYTNQYRKQHGLDSLRYDDCLVKSAGYHSGYLFNESQKNGQYKLVHQQDPSSEWFKGKTPSERAAAAGCQKYCGENALYMSLPVIQPTLFANQEALNQQAKKIARQMVFEQWHSSKGHRDNMLMKGYTSLGASVAIGKTGQTNSSGSLTANGGNMIAFGVQVFAF